MAAVAAKPGDDPPDSARPGARAPAALLVHWAAEQAALRARLETRDACVWVLPGGAEAPPDAPRELPRRPLRLVGGVDLSFVKGSDVHACAALVVLELPALRVVYQHLSMVELRAPYVPGFLGFREVPHIAAELALLRRTRPELEPQVLLVDGNGVLHPRGLGFASHLGVECGLATIGLAKKLLAVDGLSKLDVARRFDETLRAGRDRLDLRGASAGAPLLGAALSPARGVRQPVFVSVGHRLSLDTAVAVVRACSRFRVAEPVRQADLRSRAEIRRWLAARPPVAGAEAAAGAARGGRGAEEEGEDEEEEEEEGEEGQAVDKAREAKRG